MGREDQARTENAVAAGLAWQMLGTPKPQPARMESVGLAPARRAVESAALELAQRAQALREMTRHIRPGESAFMEARTSSPQPKPADSAPQTDAAEKHGSPTVTPESWVNA